MSSDADQSLSAEALRELGKKAFEQKDYRSAVAHYSDAIAADPANSKLFVNRSLSYASLGEWKLSAIDARDAVKLDAKYVKAHFRLVKALVELQMFRDARTALLIAFKECGETPDLKQLETTINEVTGIPLRPKSSDFEIDGELGEGNFSKIYKVHHKATQVVFAVKTIERSTIDRMKRRHPNIHNEILMEKRVLQKLNHPGVVTMYATFQDAGTLYYQMEYVEGGDLWAALHDHEYGSDGKKIITEQVGLHWSLIPSYFLEMLSAVEHMHRHGIVHRDIKPENVMITSSGHLKFVDFGTAKDLITTDLNGPEFVGTAEYMSPSTVQPRKSDRIGIDADLWALGVMLYQMVLGVTPFAAPSPFLTFLRIKRGKVVLPSWVPPPFAQMIHLLLTHDPAQRILNATGMDAEATHTANGLAAISYDKLRALPFFSPTSPEDNPATERTTFYSARHTVPAPAVAPQPLAVDDPYSQPAHRVPSLHDLCVRAVARATVQLSLAVANAGGARPKIPWMQRFDPLCWLPRDRQRVMHYLARKKQLQMSGVFRLCCSSVPDARCLRANMDSREVLGMSRDVQGDWGKPFHFVQLISPSLGTVDASTSSQAEDQSVLMAQSLTDQVAQLRSLVTKVNKLRPKLVMITGNLTSHAPGEPAYEEEVVAVRMTLSRISETIPVLFIPGPNDLGLREHSLQIANYHQLFGADYYGFWCGGLRGLVINSSLFLHPELDAAAARQQEEWLEEEIEQCKLSATTIAVFTYHPWFLAHAEEDDQPGVIPRAVRLVWLQRLRHQKVKLLFTAVPSELSPAAAKELAPRRPFSKLAKLPPPPSPPAHVEKEKEEEEEATTPPKPPAVAEKATNPPVEKDAEHDDKVGSGEESEAEDDGENTPYLNEDDNYAGPEQLAGRANAGVGLRAVLVTEDDMIHSFFRAEDTPSNPADLLQRLG